MEKNKILEWHKPEVKIGFVDSRVTQPSSQAWFCGLRLEGITHATSHSENEEVSHCNSPFKSCAVRVDFGHVEVDFFATKTRFWASAIPFLVMKVSFGPLGVDFELKNIDFGPLRVNHWWHRRVDFRTPGSWFLTTEGYFRHPEVCWWSNYT